MDGSDQAWFPFYGCHCDLDRLSAAPLCRDDTVVLTFAQCLVHRSHVEHTCGFNWVILFNLGRYDSFVATGRIPKNTSSFVPISLGASPSCNGNETRLCDTPLARLFDIFSFHVFDQGAIGQFTGGGF